MVCAAAALLFMAVTAQAGIIQFNLQGLGGTGLLPGNVVGGNASSGSGGEVGSGITFDDVSKLLTLNIGWGSGQGFTDLSGPVTVAHIHGPAAQNVNAGVAAGLTVANGSVNNGSIATTINASAFEANLLAGLTYVNVHTTVYGGGEIRGNLVAIPEPSTLILLAGAGGGLVIFRRKQRR